MRSFWSILVWAYYTVCFHFCLVLIFIAFILTYPFDRFRKMPNKILRLLAWLVMKPVPTWSVEIRGDNRAKVSKPTLVVANHQSFLDLPLLYLLPWNMKWVLKKSMLKIPVLGWMIAMTGHIPISRESLRSVREMDSLVEPIKAGIPGMIFPEGTRTTDGSVERFKRGAFQIAKKYNFNVLPVVLKGGHRAMPSGSWKFRFNNKFVVSVMNPLDPSDFPDAEGLKNHTRQIIVQELANIQAESNE